MPSLNLTTLLAAFLSAAPALAQQGDIPNLPPELAERPRVGCQQLIPPPQPGKSLWQLNLWTGGVVPYVFDANTTPAQQTAMRQAMDTLEAVCNVTFVPRSSQANYLNIRDAAFNNSFVGMIGGSQNVNIFNWNFRYIMCHELMHALGQWHTQNRPDRAQYVTINYNNISTTACGGSCAFNFDVQNGSVHGPYDFDSIMHYDQFAFSNNGQPTITVLPPNQAQQTLIGQTDHLSTGDIAGLVSRYGSVPSAPWTQRTPATAPSARDGHAMVYDSTRNLVVLFGGLTAAGRSNETWEWNGSSWTLRTPATTPTARHLHAMAFDSARNVTVLFGGTTNTAFTNDTWEYNGTTWTQRTPATTPTARNGHAMAYDSGLNQTILYGGATTASARSDQTWVWNGTNWVQRTITAPPAGRSGHAMVYDSRRAVTVMTGGQLAGSTTPAETWEYAAAGAGAWTLRTTTGPAGRQRHAMAYDPIRARTAFQGGLATAASNENWDWSGTAWAQRTPATSPAARSGHAMAHNALRGVTVLFGGINGTTRNAETWELGVPCASPVINAHPTNRSGCVNSNAAFTMTATGNSALTYQWRRNGTNLTDDARRSGSLTPTLTINGLITADAGNYDCVATGTCGSTNTNPATLTVNSTPAPNGLTATPSAICPGQSSVLAAQSLGNPIRWYNAATNALVTSPVTPTVTTSYYAVANPFTCPSNRSQQITVTVRTTCPADLGTTGGTPTFDCALDSNDFIVFIDYFFAGNPQADRGTTGGTPGTDGRYDNNDFIVFIDQFFAGC